jgi:hypothetical protein
MYRGCVPQVPILGPGNEDIKGTNQLWLELGNRAETWI